MTLLLYGFWRSLATFRVRAALNLKRLDYTETSVDLSQGEQFGATYHRINAQHVLPALQHEGLLLTQSLPIIEYIDETWRDAPLLPGDPSGRARVRALAQIPTADVHPLIVPRVRNFLEAEFGIAEPLRLKWIRHWFDRGSEAIEARLREADSAAGYAHGEGITIADLALVSHVVGARLFQADLALAPRLVALADRCLALPAFARAHPLAQPGAPAG
ncbi:MAG: maleylacetoacetate isomerase [Burkholderiaceae bacterium]